MSNELSRYFTGRHSQRKLLIDLASTKNKKKQIVVVNGIGGIGKTSLLDIFCQDCREKGIAVAMATIDERKTSMDILLNWQKELSNDGIKFIDFLMNINRYYQIHKQAKGNNSPILEKMPNFIAENLFNNFFCSVLNFSAKSFVPFSIVSLGSSIAFEVIFNKLSKTISKKDLEFYFAPIDILVKSFYNDISRVSNKRNIVLIIDSFEKLRIIDDNYLTLLQSNTKNTLLVIASREIPNISHIFPNQKSSLTIIELSRMQKRESNELAINYYKYLSNSMPDRDKLSKIAKFSNGIPMLLTLSLELWKVYGVDDFKTINDQSTTALIDHLLFDIDYELISVIEAISCVRWFDKTILRALGLKNDTLQLFFSKIRHLPIIKKTSTGYFMHDLVREIIHTNFRKRDVEKFYQYHKGILNFFVHVYDKKYYDKFILDLERLYHISIIDETKGILKFIEFAESLLNNKDVSKLVALLNDVNSYCRENKKYGHWIDYYFVQVYLLQRQRKNAECLLNHLLQETHIEEKLKSYVLCDLGYLYRINNEYERSINTISSAIEQYGIDNKIAEYLIHLSDSYYQLGKIEEARKILVRQQDYFQKTKNKFGLSMSYNYLKDYYLMRGNFQEANSNRRMALQIYKSSKNESNYLYSRLLKSGIISWTWLGKWKRLEEWLDEVRDLETGFDDHFNDRSYGVSLGYVKGLQKKFSESFELLNYSLLKIGIITDKSLESLLAIQIGYRGNIYKIQNKLTDAQNDLWTSLEIKKRNKDNSGVPELLLWLGEVYEKLYNVNSDIYYLYEAERIYKEIEQYNELRPYLQNAILSNLYRVQYTLNHSREISPEQLSILQNAYSKKYYDLIATNSLLHGRMFMEDGNVNLAIFYFKQSLSIALRYNRFLLDDLLINVRDGDYLYSIVNICLDNPKYGRQVIESLLFWWCETALSGAKQTFSQIEEDARRYEPGDGSSQKNVFEQLNNCLDRL